MSMNDDNEPMRVPDSALDYDEDLIFTLDGSRFTGIAEEPMPGGGTSEIRYVDGLQDGPARDWYEDGTFKGETYYRANMKHGPSREYDEQGRLRSEEIYEFGIRTSARTLDEWGRIVERFAISDSDPYYSLLQRYRDSPPV